jgi:hypothetical protein
MLSSYPVTCPHANVRRLSRVERRDWQSRYKPRRATQVLVSGKAHNQPAPAERVVGLFTHTGGLRP